MVIQSQAKVSSEQRAELAAIYRDQIASMDNSKFFTYSGDDGSVFDYHNPYSYTHQNVAYIDDTPAMSVFSFNTKNIVRVYRVLGLRDKKPKLNGIRVYPHTIIPLHYDIDQYNNGRNNDIWSISCGSDNGVVYVADALTKAIVFQIASSTDFIFNPNRVLHGATSTNGCIDYLQIQL